MRPPNDKNGRARATPEAEHRLDGQALLGTLVLYHEAFAERDTARRLRSARPLDDTEGRNLGAEARLCRLRRDLRKDSGVSIRDWPYCRLAMTSGFNTFLNTAHLVPPSSDPMALCVPRQVDHGICRRRAYPACASVVGGAATFAS